jgi:phosphoglycerate dehydrogenase-like enzyme
MLILVSIHSPFAMWNIPAEHVSRLRREFPRLTFLHATGDAQSLALIPEADIAFSSQIDREQLAAARRLRWIHSPAAGVGSMLFREMLESDVQITNSRGLAADTMGEHILAVTLALFRQLPLAFARQAERVWAQDEISARGNRSLAGARVLMIGAGAIGAATARRMSALGAGVTGIRRRSSGPHIEGFGRLTTPSELMKELPSADVVVVAAPHTADTRGMISGPQFRAMQRHAVIVNVSRGRLVDERALATALATETIAGAALDVFEQEPLPQNSPLWAAPNVLITPHTSGFRADHWDAATALFADNLRRFESGELLLNQVDKKAGY